MRTTFTTRPSPGISHGRGHCIIICIGAGATEDTIDVDTLGLGGTGAADGDSGLERLAPTSNREPARKEGSTASRPGHGTELG